MRILFLSNFYPPASRGGYEQWCQEVADGLRSRGHDVTVLTSTFKLANLKIREPEWIQRKLHLEMEFSSFWNAIQFFTSRKNRENENLSVLRRTIEDCAPNAVLIWGMWNLPRSLPSQVERLMPGKVAYYLGDYWPTLPSQFVNYWDAPARNVVTGLPKLILRPIARQILAKESMPGLLLEHTLFPSAFMRDEFERKGVPLKNTSIIYGAIDTRPYVRDQAKIEHGDKTSLLYVGRLTQDKGVHTAVDAAAQLVHGHGLQNVTLSIVGSGDDAYVQSLHQLVEQKKLTSCVKFIPALPKEDLPALYHQADIFLFTSIWPEPFGRVIVEAMASGIPVVGTRVGGAAEILRQGENALTFIPDDPQDLAQQLKYLIEMPELRRRLVETARNTALEKFGLERMISEIETYLKTLVI